MKKLKLVFALFLGVAVSGLVSCKKYEDGGTLRKAEKNLTASEWTLQSYYLNGTEMTSSLIITNFRETYAEGGTYSRLFTDSSGDLKTASGTWSLESDNSLIKISGPGSFELSNDYSSVSASEYTLLKLTEDELWYEFTNGGALHEFHLIHS